MANEKISRLYWERTHTRPRWRLPSKLNVAVGDALRLLSSHVERDMRVLEIGCAPGKHLAYLAKIRGAKVCGLDYSEPGIANSRELFRRLGLEAEFRCEDLSPARSRSGHLIWCIASGWLNISGTPNLPLKVTWRWRNPAGSC